MKILVALMIEVDESEWAAANGVTRAQVGRDVRRYVENHVQQAPAIVEASGVVTAR
jgi:hypothetical protein